MDALKARRQLSRVGISIGKLGLMAVIVAYALIITPLFGVIALLMLVFGILLTFGTIFVFVPNYGDILNNTSGVVEHIASFAKYNPYILGGAIALLIVAMLLTARDIYWEKGSKAFSMQKVTMVFGVVAIILSIVFPIISKTLGIVG